MQRERNNGGTDARASARRPSRSGHPVEVSIVSQWADGRAWEFVKGADYDSSTETFRANVKRWAKIHGFKVELRPYLAIDRDGRELPLVKTDAVALGVRFARNGAQSAGSGTGGRRRPSVDLQDPPLTVTG